MRARKKISVLGSTGSIGTQTLDILRKHPDEYQLVSLSAGRNVELLKKQIREFSPEIVSVLCDKSAREIESEFQGLTVLTGNSGNCACVEPADVVVVGIMGFAGLLPTFEALKLGKRIALANKEVLITGGHLLQQLYRDSKAEIIPVDSEHSALFQLLQGQPRAVVEKLVLTASGGPFFRFPDLDLNSITPEMAVRHPNWSMGKKISVDSATLMNKGLEFIEAHFLFDWNPDQIEIWIHPQSLVHGALRFKDGSLMTQLNLPDMRVSIGYALAYPERHENIVPPLTLGDLSGCEFMQPDEARFPCLRLAREAVNAGASSVIALNAANEVAVAAFLDGQIPFPGIWKAIELALDKAPNSPVTTVDDILAIDSETRDFVWSSIASQTGHGRGASGVGPQKIAPNTPNS